MQDVDNITKLTNIPNLLKKYIFSNIILVISFLGLFLGGVIFLRFYASIGYFPPLTWNDALIYLMIAALTGIAIIILVTLGTSIIGICLRLAIIWEKELPGIWNENKKRQDIFLFWRWYILPIIIIIIFIITFFYIAGYYNWHTKTTESIADSIMFFPALTITLLFWKSKAFQPYYIPKSLYFFTIFLNIFITLFTLINFLLPLHQLYNFQSINELLSNLIFTICVILIFCIVNSVWLLKPPNSIEPKKFYLSIFLIFLLLVFSFLSIENFGRTIMKLYGWGNIKNVSFIVNKEGYEIIKSAGIKTYYLAPNFWKTDKLYILSAIGEEYYLSNDKNSPKQKNFTIPKVDIKSKLRYY